MAWRSALRTPVSKTQPLNCQGSSSSTRLQKAGQKLTYFLLFGATGAFTLSALDDYLIYDRCSSKAIEKATSNEALKKALGEPISRGPWYNATLGLAHQKRCLSCTFPVVGSHGSGSVQLKAFCHGGNNWFTFLRPSDFEIFSLEANLDSAATDGSEHISRINLLEDSSPLKEKDCTQCKYSNPLDKKE